MTTFRKKPVELEAIQLTEDNFDEVSEWCEAIRDVSGEDLIIATLEGPMSAQQGDFIIKGVKGEFYPCKADIFELTYEEVK